MVSPRDALTFLRLGFFILRTTTADGEVAEAAEGVVAVDAVDGATTGPPESSQATEATDVLRFFRAPFFSDLA